MRIKKPTMRQTIARLENEIKILVFHPDSVDAHIIKGVYTTLASLEKAIWQGECKVIPFKNDHSNAAD